MLWTILWIIAYTWRQETQVQSWGLRCSLTCWSSKLLTLGAQLSPEIMKRRSRAPKHRRWCGLMSWKKWFVIKNLDFHITLKGRGSFYDWFNFQKAPRWKKLVTKMHQMLQRGKQFYVSLDTNWVKMVKRVKTTIFWLQNHEL